jgi:calcineurin-like phosphoesterase family protein
MDKVHEGGYKNQDQMLIHRWNKVVSQNDTVLHLGDFCIQSPPRDILKKLNGKKLLLRGNHDKGTAPFHLAQGWNSVIEGVNFSLKHLEDEQNLLNLIQNDIAANRLANSLLNCLILDYEDKRILFSHFPVFNSFNKNDCFFSYNKSILLTML